MAGSPLRWPLVTSWRQPRLLHPAAWWGWATAVAVAASRTTNPIILLLLVSATAFNGRVFSGQFGIATPQAWIAAVEAVLGLLVEGVFIAMLTQRFFGK